MSLPKPTPPPDLSDEEDVGNVISITDLVRAFLSAVPTPTDEQLHKFAALLGLDFEDFEEAVYDLLGDLVEDSGIEEDLDLFLILFFGMNPSPTEEQVHNLSELIGLNPEELEEKIYQVIQNLSSDEDDEEDDEGSEDDDDDSEDDEGTPPTQDDIDSLL